MTLGSLELVATLKGHNDRVWFVAWSPDGRTLASCSGDKTIRLWEEDGSGVWLCIHTLDDAHQRSVRQISWAPNGKYFAACSFDGTTSIWQKQAKEYDCIATLEGHENEVKSVSWDASGTLLATCGRDKSVWIWDAEDNEFDCKSCKQEHTQDVKMVKWHPARQILFSTSYDDTIKVWVEDEDDEWTCTDTLTGHQSTVWAISFSNSGDQFVTCSSDNSLKIWKTEKSLGISSRDLKYHNVSTLSGFHERTVYSVDWSDQGPIASGSEDDSIRVFIQNPEETNAAQPSFSLSCTLESAHDSDVNCVSWQPTRRILQSAEPDDGHDWLAPTQPLLLASAGDDNLVKIWRYTKYE